MEETAKREEVLDNPVWHALRGPLSRFSAPTSTAEFLQFDSDVSVFSAVDEVNDASWNHVAEVIGRGGTCALFRDAIPAPPAGWEELFRGRCLQMVADNLSDPSGLEVVRLGTRDVEDMLALAALTEPGPFAKRTHELGRYVGIRRAGRLIAMAGERFRMPGYVEISAVCSHPDARGEGLARELTLNVAQAIRAEGNQAMLHVLDENESAIGLYQKLGFTIRRSVDVVFLARTGPPVTRVY